MLIWKIIKLESKQWKQILKRCAAFPLVFSIIMLQNFVTLLDWLIFYTADYYPKKEELQSNFIFYTSDAFMRITKWTVK